MRVIIAIIMPIILALYSQPSQMLAGEVFVVSGNLRSNRRYRFALVTDWSVNDVDV